MNVYDFDETIFCYDSSAVFFLYCLRRYPRAVLLALSRSIVPAYRYKREQTDAKPLKENLFSFLPYLDDVDRLVSDFWEKNRCHVQSWYLAQKKENDVIISASPAFLLEPITAELNVGLIATRMDKYSGKIKGANCHDKEKVRRFYEQFPGGKPEEFYSDSLSDSPMAELADRAFLVRKGVLSPWPNT